MSKLYISEFAGIAHSVQAAEQPCVLDQTPVDFSGGVASSAPLDPSTTIVRLWADAECSFKFGTNPTATTNNAVLSAKTEAYFCVARGTGLKISVIAN